MEEIRNCIWQGAQVTQEEFNKLAGIVTETEKPIETTPVEEAEKAPEDTVKQTPKRGRKKAESEE